MNHKQFALPGPNKLEIYKRADKYDKHFRMKLIGKKAETSDLYKKVTGRQTSDQDLL